MKPYLEGARDIYVHNCRTLVMHMCISIGDSSLPSSRSPPHGQRFRSLWPPIVFLNMSS